MSRIHQTTLTQRSVDEHGRALALSAEENRRRREEALQAIDAVLEMGDDGEQARTLDALIRGIDAAPLSDRKRFG